MPPYIYLDFKSYKAIKSDCPDSYYNKYEYDAFLETEEGEPVLIGKGIAVLYQYEKAMNDGFDIIDAMDENHHEAIYDIMFDGDVINGTRGLKDYWMDKMCDMINFNILVSERLEILPAYRHKGYGKIIRSIKRSFFSGCYGIEILHSFPLQLESNKVSYNEWRAKQQYDTMEQDSKKAFASLNQCYKKDGYKRYKRSEYFYRLPE